MLNFLRIFISYFLYEFRFKNKNNILFSGYRNMKYNFNSKYLFEYFLISQTNYNVFFIIDNDDLRDELTNKHGNHFVTTKRLKDLKLIFEAFTWITSGGLPIRIPYANRNRVVVNLWHGLPFKGIGLLNGENTFFQNKLIKYFYSKCDFISVTSELFQQIMANSFGVNVSNTRILGQAWNDQLWNLNDRTNILVKLYGSGIPSYNKIFLYAPTWRNNRNTSFFPFPDFSLFELEQFLEEHKLLICLRTHQLDSNNVESILQCKRILLLNEDKIVDIMSILNIFDGLISDYSGIIFDFLLLDRPIILLPYDKAEYVSERRVNFDFNSFEFSDSPNDTCGFLKQLKEAISQSCISSKQQRFKTVVHYFADNRNCYRHYIEIDRIIKSKYRK